MAIVVFGSINMDLVVRTPRLPVAGETIVGHDFFTAPGGKGANQAVACARLGAVTSIVGRVGNDVFAKSLLDSLSLNKVETRGIYVDQERPSGVALIEVDDASENNIIIVPGANGAVQKDDLLRLDDFLNEDSVLMLQLEIPIDTVLEAAQLAHEKSALVVFDPAPAQTLPQEFYEFCDVITPNEIEAELMVGFAINNRDDAAQAAKVLLGKGAKNVIIKMGKRGAYWSDGISEQFFTAYAVQAVDSVAAGDAFNGGLAVSLAEGLPVQDAIRWGMAAGALSTTKQGAQPSMPDRGSVHRLVSGRQNVD